MKYGRSQLILMCVLLFVHATAFAAAAPSLMNYQGLLTDPAGAPLTGTYSIAFTIYNNSTGGDVMWQETQSGVVVTDGLFNVTLGSNTALGAGVLTSPNTWLAIKMGTDPEITPRTRLVTVPYAHRVSTVDGSTGGAISGNINLEASTALVGNITKGGTLFIHNFGVDNTFIGRNAGNLTMSGIGGNTGCGANSLTGNTTGEANTASGANALQNNTTGNGNTATGSNALNHNTSGYHNTANGFLSLGSNTTGIQNTANGVIALTSNTTGNFNTAIGYNALFSNTTGYNNTASGTSALWSNTTGFQNTASGVSALASNSTGSDNTATGVFALTGNTTGSSNTACGKSALLSNTTGNCNTATGRLALGSNTTGYSNTANGVGALFGNTTGYSNVANGDSTLFSNTSGDWNTASGHNALYSNTTGYYNTTIGGWALYNNTTGYHNAACGVSALYSNTIGVDNTASGDFALHGNTEGVSNTASGIHALQGNTTGSNNTASGAGALLHNTTGSLNTAIGSAADVMFGNLTNATAIGNGATVDASNKIRLGNNSVTVICGPVAFTACSDRNLKENFRPTDGAEVLKKIRGLSLSSWNYIGHDPKQFRHYGPVAQEFFAAFGHDGLGQSGDSTTINSGDMAGILMIAVQELERRTTELYQEKELLRGAVETIQEQQKVLLQQQNDIVELRKFVTEFVAVSNNMNTTPLKK